jgi:CheY-like chemotaxis protein/MinD-like ATPase involved in chromosome partitioning or flagellar assembly
MAKKILIVDDEPTMLRMLGMTLEAAGYTVVVAQQADTARAKIGEEKPDLLVLDIMMPGISGVELLKELRADPETKALPVILLSALSTVEDKISGLKAGADEYLTKPIDPREFIARVASLLARTQRLRESSSDEAGKVVSFLGVKGGVGTSSLALNVAGALARGETSVVAAELHASAGTFAKTVGIMTPTDIRKMLLGEPEMISRKMVSGLLDKHPAGIRLLCYPPDETEVRRPGADTITRILDALQLEAQFVILDLGQMLDEATRTALEMSDAVILVLEPTPVCLDAGLYVSSVVRKWASGASLIGVAVVNRSALASSLNQEAIQEHLKLPVISMIPQAGDLLANAYRRGQLLIAEQPDHMASGAIERVASALREL